MRHGTRFLEGVTHFTSLLLFKDSSELLSWKITAHHPKWMSKWITLFVIARKDKVIVRQIRCVASKSNFANSTQGDVYA